MNDRARRSARFAAMAALGVLGAAMVASAPLTQASAQGKARQCFRAQDWQGTTSGGPRDLFIRVGMKDVWHVGLTQDCPGAAYPGPVRVIANITGSNEICAAADMQISVSPQGFSNSTSCIVGSLDKLTPAQIAALPRKAVP